MNARPLRMNQRLWIVAAPVVLGALAFYAVHTYEQNQAYKTGLYIGKVAFSAADYQNRRCLSFDSAQRGCEVRDLNRDASMENSLASANIIPELADSVPLHTGFRDGWRAARTTASSR